MRAQAMQDEGPGARVATLEVLRLRARAMVRNNPHARRAKNAIVANTVGYGISPRITSALVAKRWAEWADTTACDAAGVLTFGGIQAVAVGAVVESGEVFLRRRWRSGAEGLPVPMQIQVLEPDYLDTSKHQLPSDGSGHAILHGIEYDERSRPVAYWFRTEHPSMAPILLQGYESVRVPAEDVIHLMWVERPGQTRGVTWLAPVMTRISLLEAYEDAALERARIAACFTAFIRDPIGDGLPDRDGASGSTPSGEGDGEVPPGSVPEETDEDAEPDDWERIEPGTMVTLPTGKDVTFGSPPPISDYQPFVETNLRAIAVGIGVPYEVLTGDLSKTSFSSARIGWLEFHRLIEQWRWLMIVPGLCDRIWRWFADALEVGEGIDAGARPEWSPPRREMISPTEETRSLREQVRSGFKTWPAAVRELGDDPDAVLDEIATYNAKADALGVVLECDPRKIGGPSGNVAIAAELEKADQKEPGDAGT
jgi:lambda family phage portal protein